MMPGSFANHDRTRGALPVHLFGGTEGSNPSPSSGESGANSTPRLLRPTSCEPRARTADSRIGTRKTITLRNEAELSGSRAHPEGMPLPPNALTEPASYLSAAAADSLEDVRIKGEELKITRGGFEPSVPRRGRVYRIGSMVTYARPSRRR